MIAFGIMSLKSDNQISQTFPIRQLPKHQREELIPTSEMLHIFVAIILSNDVIEFISIQESDQLREHEFIFMHLQPFIRIEKMRIQICLIGNRLQLTKFQIFQRAILDFNGTAMK